MPDTSATISTAAWPDFSTWPSLLWDQRDFLFLEARIIGTAMTLIYIGSQAAIRRPPSAKPKKVHRDKSDAKHADEGEDEEAEDDLVQGLELSDAIMFPILGGVILVGIYYLIKWLGDADMLNKIFMVYFSIMSVASMGKLFADTLNVLATVIFPDVWRDDKGIVWFCDGPTNQQYQIDESGKSQYNGKNSPLPGTWPSVVSLSQRSQYALWHSRRLVHGKWPIHLLIRGVIDLKAQVKLGDIVGYTLAMAIVIVQRWANSSFISNLMGFGFSYTSIILMSPTSFSIGSAVLFGLFFYDIYMVFYTPYMVTVATKLDVPIKLTFQGPAKKASMLGLGDIVVPGMFVGLCLRFDLFMHYYRRQKYEPIELKTEAESAGAVVTTKETQRIVVKPEYIKPTGQWGNRLWTSRLISLKRTYATPHIEASAFPKPYFFAAMMGYFLAMIATLAMLLVFNHAQPALLYLVPGVVFAVWLTGAIRGELREMWIYTEDGTLDKTDVVVEVDADGRPLKAIEEPKDKENGKTEEEKKADGEGKRGGDDASAGKGLEKAVVIVSKAATVETASKRVVFSFSIMAPETKAEGIKTA